MSVFKREVLSVLTSPVSGTLQLCLGSTTILSLFFFFFSFPFSSSRRTSLSWPFCLSRFLPLLNKQTNKQTPTCEVTRYHWFEFDKIISNTGHCWHKGQYVICACAHARVCVRACVRVWVCLMIWKTSVFRTECAAITPLPNFLWFLYVWKHRDKIMLTLLNFIYFVVVVDVVVVC